MGILAGLFVVTALVLTLRLHRAHVRVRERRRLPLLWTSSGLEARERRARP
jgi:hypothetical protein